MSKSWSYGILADAVNKGSSNISLNKISEETGNYPVYGAKGFAKNISFFQQENEYLGIIKDGAGIGRVSKHPANSSILATMQYIIPKDGFEINFIKYFLDSIDFESYRTGSTIPHIYFKDYKNQPFPLIDVKEQKQIVAILDQVFTAIIHAQANIQQNIKNAQDLFQSKLNQIFSSQGLGWKERTLEEVCSITSKLIDPRDDEHLDLSHIGAGNIESISGVIKEVKTARQENLISGKFIFDERMVLYSKIRPYLMKVCRPKFKGLCSADIYPLTPFDTEINRDYLFYLLLSPSFTSYAIKGSARSGMPKVNRSHLFSYTFYLPELPIQRESAISLDHLSKKTEAAVKVYEEKLLALEELKKSLLKKAFSGDLTQDKQAA